MAGSWHIWPLENVDAVAGAERNLAAVPAAPAFAGVVTVPAPVVHLPLEAAKVGGGDHVLEGVGRGEVRGAHVAPGDLRVELGALLGREPALRAEPVRGVFGRLARAHRELQPSDVLILVPQPAPAGGAGEACGGQGAAHSRCAVYD